MNNWHAERSLRIAEEQQTRQLAITQATSDLIATADIDGFLISLNSAGFDLLAIPHDTDISRLRLADFYTAAAAKNLAKSEMPNAVEFSVWHSETTLKTSTNETIPCSQILISHSDRYAKVAFFSIILRDISSIKKAEKERKLLMEQLHQSKKMETVGRLAGGVAHDFNNILTVIMGYAELGLLNMESDSVAKDELEIILDSAQKAARLSNQLLDFSSKQIEEAQALDLNQVLEESQQLIESLLGEEIILSTTFEKGLWPVSVDHSQLEQIILNLAVNARDAILADGSVNISTENLQLSSKAARDLGLDAAGDYVQLTVSDSGCGMNSDIIDHIFEPFYTTKQQGKGTGLGLSAVYGAVKQNNGHISVKSSPGNGTSFEIFLHRSSEQLLTPQDIDIESLATSTKHERILLVEDNTEVRELLSTLLQDLGYRVVAAENGEAAIATLKNTGTSSIDLVISDVVMPQMNGLDLYRKLKMVEPGLPALLISGHADRTIEIREQIQSNVTLLSKPIPCKVLAQEIWHLLN